ncbi:MAG: reverse transcriptase domain-containing protein, partial [Gaiellaceae bacterium]
VDDEGNQFLLLKEIVNHQSNNTCVAKDDMWTLSSNGNRHKRRTTKGWQLCVYWKDGSTTWEPLRNLKESNPIEVAEYAVANKIADEPAFSWWVEDVLRRRNRIINKVRTRYWKRTHKFGIQLPKSVDEALSIDNKTGTDFWYKAIQKEMTNVMPAFQFLDADDKVPVGYKWIPCHMVFDIKMDFTRKARLVAGGHVTDPPTSHTYSSVVSRDSIRIALLVAALNDLDILAADIGNAYLNATTKEKVYTTAGREFGSRQGQSVLIVRALYGLKTSGAAWRAHLAQTLRDMNYLPCLADPDVWMRRCTKPDGFEYYEYLLVYVDDILCISHQPTETMSVLGKLYRLKDNTVERPKQYLGATVKQWRFDDDSAKIRWGLSSEEYVSDAIKNVEFELQKINRKLPSKTSTPMISGYRPELDVSPLLDDKKANYYQNLIGVLCWAVELART